MAYSFLFSMHRFYLKKELPSEGVLLMQDVELAHQLRDVLKIRLGESIILFNGTGFDFELAIKKLGSDHVFGHIIKKRPNECEPLREVTLWQSLIKKDKLELVLAKCTEIGVSMFRPFVSARSVKKGIQRERLEKILKESTEQCGGDIIPELKSPVAFEEVVKVLSQDAKNILFDPRGEKWSHPSDAGGNINIFIGPEGGFTEDELKMFQDAGGVVYSLGARILRSETAAIVAVGLYFAG